ncbi:hypothetical protein HMPREF9124_0702 [Oribacterium sp. oral taxon 108 str. F0425]|nr:hypothetical protein HMPREF9124_0702 [Oribacterium sp. oral taxon 108 str. F0425]
MVKKRIELHHPSLLFIMCVKRAISCSKQVVAGRISRFGFYPDFENS